MNEDNPTVDTLYNYDQNWRTPPYAEDIHFQGTAVINLYIAPDGFNFDNEGELTVYLRDYDPASDTYTEINNFTYEIEEGEWTQMWQPTAPEGKYKIVATADDTRLESLVALGFGYIRTLYFINTGAG